MVTGRDDVDGGDVDGGDVDGEDHVNSQDDWTDAPDQPDDADYIGARDLGSWQTSGGQALAGLAVRAVRSLQPRGVAVVTLAAGLVLCALLTSAAAEIYDQVLDGQGLARLDRPVLDAAVGWRSDGLTTVVKAYTWLGGPVGMPVLATVVLVVLAWRWRSPEPVVLGAVAAAGSLLMTVVGKDAVGRARPPVVDAVPPVETSFSFPSGHALNAVAVAGIVAYLVLRRQHSPGGRVLTPVLAIVFAVLMGLSRVYLGHHWLTDVLVAWVLGLAWLTFVITAHRLYLTSRRAHHRHLAAHHGGG
jgi:membrane-associated phospholipid phosphatase